MYTSCSGITDKIVLTMQLLFPVYGRGLADADNSVNLLSRSQVYRIPEKQKKVVFNARRIPYTQNDLLIIVFSFLPVFAAIPFGSLPVFVITSVLAACYDAIFVVMQRYNRPRIMRLIEKTMKTQ